MANRHKAQALKKGGKVAVIKEAMMKKDGGSVPKRAAGGSISVPSGSSPKRRARGGSADKNPYSSAKC